MPYYINIDVIARASWIKQDQCRINSIRQNNSSGGVRLWDSLPSHVGGVKEIGETGKEDRGKIVDLRFEIADWGFVLRTPTLRAGSQFRIVD